MTYGEEIRTRAHGLEEDERQVYRLGVAVTRCAGARHILVVGRARNICMELQESGWEAVSGCASSAASGQGDRVRRHVRLLAGAQRLGSTGVASTDEGRQQGLQERQGQDRCTSC